ncbi:MAG: lamin tail domain-containing protein [Candidatus Sungiibacteriota bacterium]
MRNAWLYVLLALAVLALAPSAFASVVINEALFDPVGNDTGFEKIELYNNGESAVNMSGWELFPGDGVGYFVFPSGFSFLARSFVAVHLKTSGTNDASNLFHAAASGNMGNSSGSVALFSESGHPADSIADFVRYKKGTSDIKTWESAASAKELWVVGQFVDISNLSEGNSIALSADGVRGGPSLWHIATSPTIGSSNSADIPVQPVSGDQQIQQSEQGAAGSEDSSAPDPGRPMPPSLKAYAGKDRTAVQGAVVEFRGSADGINGEPLTSARFAWNFGDGTTKEGKIVSHVYYFPGVYTASLDVSSGEYAGSDYVKLTVLRPDIFISEAKGGAGGFLELYNNTANRLDLGGFQLKDGAKSFSIPMGTLIQANSALVFPNAVTGLFGELRSAALFDALDNAVDSVAFSGPLLIEESFERSVPGEKKFIRTKMPTPGVYVLIAAAAEKGKSGIPIPANPKTEDGTDAKTENVLAAAGEQASVARQPNGESRAEIAASGSMSSFWLFGASIVVGLLAAAAFLLLRRI